MVAEAGLELKRVPSLFPQCLGLEECPGSGTFLDTVQALLGFLPLPQSQCPPFLKASFIILILGDG